MYDTILFDLDGTLTDPKAGITQSVQYALAKLGIAEPDPDQLIPFIGPPLIKSFQEFYQLDDQQASLAVQYYRERFACAGLYENAVFPGIQPMLEQLKELGKTLVVATSKPTIYSVKILEYFDLRRFFLLVAGSNLDGTRVEKDEVIAFVRSELPEADPAGMIMVGDRKYDVLGAKNNGIAVAAVGYGYGSQAELKAAKPDYLLATVQELHRFLQEH